MEKKLVDRVASSSSNVKETKKTRKTNGYSDFMSTRVPSDTSLARVTRLLDLFEVHRVPLSSQQIADALDAPRSSVGTLLKSLADLGWLSLDRRSATWFPTARVGRWGGWLSDASWLDPRLVDAVHALQRATSETVSLSAPGDLTAEVIYVAGQSGGIRLAIEVGQRLPLAHSAIGWAHCSTLPDTTIRSLATRSAAADGNRRGSSTAIRDLLAHAREARRQGYAYAAGEVLSDVAAFAAPLPAGLAAQPLVISVGGPRERVWRHRKKLPKLLLSAAASLAAQGSDTT